MARHQFQTTNIKGKEYVTVNERISYFRTSPEYAGFSLTTRIIELNSDICVMEAIIASPDGQIIANGFAREESQASYINKTSYVENCETSAWGRALGNLGIGIKTSIATADEVANAIYRQEAMTKVGNDGQPINHRAERADSPHERESNQVVSSPGLVDQEHANKLHQDPQATKRSGFNERSDKSRNSQVKANAKDNNGHFKITQQDIDHLYQLAATAGVDKNTLEKTLDVWNLLSLWDLSKDQYKGISERLKDKIKAKINAHPSISSSIQEKPLDKSVRNVTFTLEQLNE